MGKEGDGRGGEMKEKDGECLLPPPPKLNPGYATEYALHWGCGSIICPIPFPSRLCLITSHTSTATTVVNNRMFTRRDAIVVAVGRATDQTEVLGEPTLE